MVKVRRYIEILILLLLLGGAGANSVSGQNSDEYLLKSVSLYKICKYAEWPESSMKKDSFKIIVLGNPDETKQITIPGDKKLFDKPIKIVEIRDYKLINTCQALFICSSNHNKIKEILNFIKSKDILVFGDTPDFCEKGVMVNLLIKDERIVYEFNLIAINNSSIKLNSQLYTIGRIISIIE